MSNRHIQILALIAAVASPAAASAAQQAAAPQSIARTSVVGDLGATFKGVDTNNDGMLSQAEIAAAETKALAARVAEIRTRLDSEFTRADTNKDGQLSKAEFVAAGPQPPTTRPTGADVIADLDKNKDGKVSLTEFSARRLAAFDAIDKNHDGVLSVAERQAASR